MYNDESIYQPHLNIPTISATTQGMQNSASPNETVDSLERIIPHEMDKACPIESESLTLHLERYQFALENMSSGNILDIACGVGYGTKLIAERDSQNTVVGVDRCEKTITYAQINYGDPRINYQLADAIEFTNTMPPESFHSIVSLETIEHLKDPQAFLAKLFHLLKPGGILITSVPTTPSTDGNPHHLSDFTEESFRKMFARFDLCEISAFSQIQPFRAKGVRRKGRLEGMRSRLWLYYLRHPRALLRRLHSLATDGFKNKYITLALRRSG